MPSPQGRKCLSQQGLKACLLITLIPRQLLPSCPQVFYSGQRTPPPPLTSPCYSGIGGKANLSVCRFILRPSSVKEIRKN